MMQNWKIKRMSNKELLAQLKVVGSLLYYYQKGRDYINDCPLCEVATKYHQRAVATCYHCLWRIIEGDSCMNFSEEEFGSEVTDMTDKEDWHKVRIPMLRQWKKILKTELARRDV